MRAALFCLLFLVAFNSIHAQSVQDLENDLTNAQLPIPPVVEDILLSTLGFVEGADILGQLQQLNSCVFDSESFKTALNNAIAEFKTLTPAGISSGINTFSGSLAQEILDCGNTGEEAEALLIGIFGNITNTTFDEQGLWDLVESYQAVLDDVAGAIASFQNASWLNFGSSIGQVVGVFLFDETMTFNSADVAAWPMNNDTIPMPVQYIVDVLEGFVSGTGFSSNLTMLPQCVNSIENFTVLIQEVVTLYENATTQSIQQATTLLGSSIQLLVQANVSCQATWGQFVPLVKEYVGDFANATVDEMAVFDLILNYPQTLSDATAIATYLKVAEWFNFGQAVGNFTSYIEETFVEAEDQESFLAFA